MLDSTNTNMLHAVSVLLAEGKIDAEAAGKLLNTAARYEERMHHVYNQQHHN